MSKVYAPGLSGNAAQKAAIFSAIAVDYGLCYQGDQLEPEVLHEPSCVYLYDRRRACNCDPTVTLQHILTAPGPNGLQ